MAGAAPGRGCIGWREERTKEEPASRAIRKKPTKIRRCSSHLQAGFVVTDIKAGPGRLHRWWVWPETMKSVVKNEEGEGIWRDEKDVGREKK